MSKFNGTVEQLEAAVRNSADIDDAVIDEGILKGWHYRKWKNGTAECWGIFGQHITVNSLWGSGLYYGNGTTRTFPFTFIEVPICTVSNNGYTATAIFVNGTAPTTTETQMPRIILPSSQPESLYNVGFRAIGKWK